MNHNESHIEFLLNIAHSPVKNYVIPGLTSYLIGEQSKTGTVRLFVNERDHQENITPHSHRFNFMCVVLRGEVKNRVWERRSVGGDQFQATHIKYMGEIGSYQRSAGDVSSWIYTDSIFRKGEKYGMKANEVHSIFFSRGAVVLFFEGPQITDTSIMIEPFVDGAVIPSMKIEPWMFKRTEEA